MDGLWIFLSRGIRQLFHGEMFLDFWWFRSFLEGLVILMKIVVLVWFFVFDCYGNFRSRDRRFMDDKIFEESKVFPWCIGF